MKNLTESEIDLIYNLLIGEKEAIKNAPESADMVEYKKELLTIIDKFNKL